MQPSSGLRNIIVTGANKGIGYSIVELLYSGKEKYNIILTARNTTLGTEALKQLSEKYPDASSKLIYQQLDVDDNTSVDRFVDWISSNYDKVDALVNNAGIGYYSKTPEERLATIKTNFLSIVNLTEKILPKLADDGKIIMISSGAGELASQNKTIHDLLSDEALNHEKLMRITHDLNEKTKNLEHTSLGWSDHTYGATKALLNAYTRWVLPKQLKPDQQCFTVCPGWCRTDMGGPSAIRSKEQGADTPVWLINLPWKRDDTLFGQFLRDRKKIAF